MTPGYHQGPDDAAAPGGIDETAAVARRAWAELHAQAHEHPVVVVQSYVTTVDDTREVRSDG